MPIDLYQLPASPPCRAVIMTAQHIGVELNCIKLDILGGEQFKPEFIQINPQHTIPTIYDDGFYLWESRAIQTYLVNKYAPGNSIYPEDPQARAVVDRMLQFDIGTLYKGVFPNVFSQALRGEPADPEKEEVMKKGLTLLEEFLGKTPYVAGDNLTLADFSIYASVTFTAFIDYSFDSYPKISEWMRKMKEEVPNCKEINEDPINELSKVLSKSRI